MNNNPFIDINSEASVDLKETINRIDEGLELLQDIQMLQQECRHGDFELSNGSQNAIFLLIETLRQATRSLDNQEAPQLREVSTGGS